MSSLSNFVALHNQSRTILGEPKMYHKPATKQQTRESLATSKTQVLHMSINVPRGPTTINGAVQDLLGVTFRKDTTLSIVVACLRTLDGVSQKNPTGRGEVPRRYQKKKKGMATNVLPSSVLDNSTSSSINTIVVCFANDYGENVLKVVFKKMCQQ